MSPNEISALFMDTGLALGNTEDVDGLRALHVKVKNKNTEAIPFTLAFPQTPKIYNLNLLLANTEYSQAITNNAKSLTIRARNIAKLQIAFVLGDSLLNFMTVPAGTSFSLDGILATGLTVYLSSSKPNTIVEILEWS